MRVNAEGIVSLLRANLIDRYKDCFCIIQELLQNADDAKATRVHFGVSTGLDVDHPLGRLPALYIVNDGPVSYSNMASIYTVASGDKGNASDKIGKFGLGMKSVFHVCEGFFMFGNNLSEELSFPYFCTPWTEEYHDDWHQQWPGAKAAMAAQVKEKIASAVDGWDRWFCVWLPLREEALHSGESDTKPIIQMYPSERDLDVFTGSESAMRAARMLPLMRRVEHLSFASRKGNIRRFDLNPDGRVQGGSGELRGSLDVDGLGLVPYEYIGREEKLSGSRYSSLKVLRCWPKNTSFVKGKGLQSYPDKTDSHVAICLIKEQSELPTLTVSPCVNLPLSDVRENPGKYVRERIGGKHSVTIDLHGNLFVDAGRQVFDIGEELGREPSSETELRKEWNRRLLLEGIFPLFVPELYRAISAWDVETADAVMGALKDISFLSKWRDAICERQGIARELRADGYHWSLINSGDEIVAIEPPRSPVVRRLIASALPEGTHVIDATAGRLLPSGAVQFDFSDDLCLRFLSAIAKMPEDEADNDILRQFAQDCASRIDFERQSSELKAAKIWKVDGRRVSYDEVAALASGWHLYCHAEGELKKLFLASVDWHLVQITEPLCKALKLSVPDFSFEFILDVLGQCPALYSPNERCALLEELLGAKKLRGTDSWTKGCRYLVHGIKALFESTDPLYMPLEGEYGTISEKIINALSKQKWGARCELPPVVTKLLSGNDQELLNLPLSRPERLIVDLAALPVLPAADFSDDDWKEIVMMVPGLFERPEVVSAIKKIAVFPGVGGGRTALGENVFYENKFAVPPLLANDVILVALDGEGKPFERLKRLTSRWNPNDCIRLASRKMLEKAELSDVLMTALQEEFEPAPDVRELLENKSWVLLNNGSWVSPREVMSLDGFSELVPGCITVDDISAERVRDTVCDRNLCLPRYSSGQRLFQLMAANSNGIYNLGRIAALRDGRDLRPLVAAMGEGSLLPAIDVLLRLQKLRVPYGDFQSKLYGELTLDQMCAVVNTLTSRANATAEPEERTALMSFLCAYLDDASSRGDFISNVVSSSRFFNRDGRLKGAHELCVGVEGVPDKYILSSEYDAAPRFVESIKSTVLSKASSGWDKQTPIGEYFSGWDPEFDERIGGFVTCCSDQPADIELVRKRYGFDHKNIEETREGLAYGLHGLLNNQHCYILATPEDGVSVVSINGKPMSITVTPLSGANDLFCGQLNTCEYVKNSVLQMSMGNPPLPPTDRSLILRLRKLQPQQLLEIPAARLDLLLKNTLIKILFCYAIQDKDFSIQCQYKGVSGGAVDHFWDGLKHSEQLAVKVTKSIILQSLNTYLPMINCRHAKLKRIFGEWFDLQNSVVEAEQNRNSANVSKYRTQLGTLQKQLEGEIVADEDLRAAILNALRVKMQDDYQYDIGSILFELFQNADDATEELFEMYGDAAPELRTQFSVRYDERCLVVAHWGRPINLSKVGPESDPKFASFRTDLQKMLMLSQSGKGGEGIRQDGKFGLGFKTVFFVTDTPYVCSGKLKFKIVGGLMPEPVTEEEDADLREYLAEFETAGSSQKPTVYVLPLLSSRLQEVGQAVSAFKGQIDILSLFAKRIRQIDVRSVDGVLCSAPSERQEKYSVVNLGAGQLLLEKGESNRPVALPSSVPTYWVTAPTQTRADLGVAVNASFDLDTGRSYLNTKSTKNGALIRNLAIGLYQSLAVRYDSLGTLDRYGWFASLFQALFVDRISNWRPDDNNSLAKAMWSIFWDHDYGALWRLVKEKQMIPSMLSGEYQSLCRLGDVEWMVCDDVMASGLVETARISRLKPGCVVARSSFWSLGQAFFPDVIRSIPAYDLAKFLDDLVSDQSILSPGWCAKGNAERLYALVKGHIGEDAVRDRVRKVLFASKTGSGVSPSKALIATDEGERLRAAFAPEANLISEEYDEPSLRLVKLFRCEKRLSGSELAVFAAQAEPGPQRSAVLVYLASDEVSDEFKEELRALIPDSWLADWKTDPAAKDLSRRQRIRIIDVISASEDDFGERLGLEFFDENIGLGDDETDDDIQPSGFSLPSLSDVLEWWPAHQREAIADYNMEAYGRSEVDTLSFDRDSPESRQEWMEVLLLGAAHRIGFKLCQHKGFIQMLKSKGWWKVYCQRSVSPREWMETLDEYLESEELNGGQYSYWFRLFIRIYQFSRHLDIYMQLFESANYADGLEKVDLAAIKMNPKLSGTGIDAPGLQYALGGCTGLAFVYRELVRRGAIANEALYRFCYVPYPKVSEFSSCYRSSEDIYEKAVRELGRDKATFDLSFDIAITSYLKSGRK